MGMRIRILEQINQIKQIDIISNPFLKAYVGTYLRMYLRPIGLLK